MAIATFRQFHFATAVESAQEPLSTESAWSRLLKSPYDCLEGIFWGAAFSSALYECYQRVRELRRFSLQDLRCEETRENLKGEVKATANAFFGLFGYASSSLEWADRSRLIVLGKLVSLVQKISYMALFVNAGFGVDKCLETIKKMKCDIFNETDPVAKSRHERHYRAAILDLASHISTIAWALLGLVKLCFAVVISPALSSAVLMVSCAFALASFSYGIYVAVALAPPEEQQPEEARA